MRSPELPASTLSPEHCTSPDVLAHEAERLLRCEWICVAREDPVAEPGDSVAFDPQCVYHRRTHGLDGRLVGAPDTQRTPGFERKQIALPSLPVEVWHDFVFTNLDPAAASPEPLVFEHDWNWKIRVENFDESYPHQGPNLATLQSVAPASGT